MPIEIQTLPRTFRYNSLTLEDPGPQFDAAAVRDLYSATYPEIVNAAIEGPEEKDGKLEYTFRRAVGTKGGWPLTFDALRDANLRRLPRFRNRLGEISHTEPDGSDWSLAEWTNAVAGEVGEACNLAKKIVRGDFGNPDSPEYRAACRELAKELADVVTYADITCTRAGHQLGEVTAAKFNEVSERVGCDVKL